MKREIKFRVFHNGEEMVYFGLGNSIPDGEPMQYTGLKDKNGVEIYEGDIVNRVGFKVKDIYTDSVVFDAGRFCFYENGLPIGYVHKELLEVIGNVYENPELLK